MSLGDHFRELRARIMRIALYLVVATIDRAVLLRAAVRADPRPLQRRPASQLGQTTQTEAVITGVGTPLMLQLKICGIAAIVGHLAAVAAGDLGLHRPGPAPQRAPLDPHLRVHGRPAVHLRRRAGLLRAAQGHRRADRLHPVRRRAADRVRRLLHLHHPDAAGLRGGLRDPAVRGDAQPRRRGLRARRWAGYRPWIIVGVFVFAAVATPSTDPYSMLMLAIPMLVLVLASEVISRILDRRRAPRRTDGAGTTTTHSPI